MKKENDIIMRRGAFAWVALFTGVALLVPWTAMQFKSAMNWDETDYIVMALLVFCAGSAFVLLARVTPCKYRVMVGVLITALLVFIWAELAVGIFTNLGS